MVRARVRLGSGSGLGHAVHAYLEAQRHRGTREIVPKEARLEQELVIVPGDRRRCRAQCQLAAWLELGFGLGFGFGFELGFGFGFGLGLANPNPSPNPSPRCLAPSAGPWRAAGALGDAPRPPPGSG